MLGQIVEWFHGDLAGLAPDPAFPGFGRLRIRPQPVPGVTWARAAHASPRGPVSELPPNSSAEVSVPAADVGDVREGGAPVGEAPGVRFVRQEGSRVVLAIDSGRYTISTTRSQ